MEYIHGNEKLLPRVTAVEACPDFRLLLTFRNGEQRVFDASSLLSLPAYRRVREIFNSACVEFGTVVWPGDIDISPDMLYLKSVPIKSKKNEA